MSQLPGQESAILIIDKQGAVGLELAKQLSKSKTVIFVSKASPEEMANIVHIPFGHLLPEIPSAAYSHIFFVVEEGSEDLLEPVEQKAYEDKSKLLFIVSYEDSALLQKTLYHVRRGMHCLVLGDVFGSPQKNEFDSWLMDSKQKKSITMQNMGLLTFYPVLFADAIQAILSSAFTQHEEKVLLAYPPHPVTQIALVHAIKKVDPDVRIIFSQEEGREHQPFKGGSHILHQTYNSLGKLQEYYKNLVVQQEAEFAREEKAYFPQPYVHTSKKKRNTFFLFYSLTVFLSAPLLVLIGSVFIAKSLLGGSLQDVSSGQLKNAYTKSQAAESYLTFANQSLQLLRWEAFFLPFGPAIRNAQAQLDSAQLASQTLERFIFATQKLQSVLLGTSLSPNSDAIDSANAYKQVLENLQKLPDTQLPDKYKALLQEVRPLVANVQFLPDALPALLGTTGERTYMLLFQNNMELRPGGGFVGSYGVLQLGRGKIKDFSIHDVYDADGQLKGHVEPPFAIRRYLPLVHLYLRDSTFDVDFAKDAQIAATMYNLETGDSADGVIAIDLSFVKNLLQAIGSVYVPTYNQTVNADNFFLLTEQHAEQNSFAGSTQKQDFLNSFFTALQNKLTQTKSLSYENIAMAALTSLEEKHLLVGFSDATLQAPFTVNGWSSSLLQATTEKNAFNDFVGINEANLGVNKANYFISRKVTQNVTVDNKGQVNSILSMAFTNSSQVGQWPGGDYKNYLRLILPKGTQVQSVTINGISQKLVDAITDPKIYEGKYFVASKGLEVEKTAEEGKDVFGFLVTVPAQQTAIVVVQYQVPGKADITSLLSTYHFSYFKQPGVDNVPYTLSLAYPQNFSVFKATDAIKKQGNLATWTSDIRKDTSLSVTFSQKPNE